jgi:hypothetical protein
VGIKTYKKIRNRKPDSMGTGENYEWKRSERKS